MIVSILKIIGLILLIILCVLLVLILLVLFVPVRYAAEFEYDDRTLRLDIKAVWLLSLIRCYAGLREKRFFYKVKALFFSVIDSERAKKEPSARDTGQTAEKESVSEAAEHKENVAEAAEQMTAEKSDTTRAAEENVAETAEQMAAEKSGMTRAAEENVAETAEQMAAEKSDMPQKEEEKPAGTQKKQGAEGKQEPEKNAANDKTEKKFRFPFKIMHPADIYDKIVRALMDLSRKLDKICAQVVSEENRETVLFVLTQIKELFYHIRPRKHGIYLKLGMKDPSLTGQIMGAYSVLNSVFGMNFVLEPYFDREILETKMYFKGHIRVISLIIIAIRLYRNKTIRKLIRRK